ncbi:MAG: acetyl-CoA carboxylase biotin carboxyl carrier protein [Terriglobales bacterium]|jgi:acetyl-CoA carboxylase biotin carboxyl carrier protein
MNLDEIKELIDLLVAKEISEFELERGDVKLRIRRGVSVAAPAAAAIPVQASAGGAQIRPDLATAGVVEGLPGGAENGEAEGLHTVHSPIVGTFYEAASPGAPPLVKVGDRVQIGQVLCIIEAMKLMNEIEADADGEIVKRFVENAQPVEYGQALFVIKK